MEDNFIFPGVENGERSTRVPIARLTYTAHVDYVSGARPGIKIKRLLQGYLLLIQFKNHWKMGMTVEKELSGEAFK
jgi:hypothetical protein